jgi:predicted nucleotidyltransferase
MEVVEEERRPPAVFTVAERDAVLARAVELLDADERVEAAVLTGSLGRSGGDRWSDIDLNAVIAQGVDCRAVAADWERLVYREWPVAHHYATEFGSTLVWGYLFRNALLLDMAFGPIDDFAAWAPTRVIFDRTGRATEVAAGWSAWSPTPDASAEAGFAAHDVLHACLAANRGRRWQSLYFLQRIRTRTLALASERHGFDSDDLPRIDDVPAEELGALEGALVAKLEPAALLEAIDLGTRAFLEELRRHDTALADRLSQPLLALIAASREGV